MKLALIISETAKANPGDSRIGRTIGTAARPTGLAMGLSLFLRHTDASIPGLQGKAALTLAQQTRAEGQTLQ